MMADRNLFFLGGNLNCGFDPIEEQRRHDRKVALDAISRLIQSGRWKQNLADKLENDPEFRAKVDASLSRR
jgi:hypothetical protein